MNGSSHYWKSTENKILWFRHWVFYYKNYKKFSDFSWKYYKKLMFDYWKYYYDENKELGKQKYATIPFNKLEEFITYYLNIKVSHSEITWLCFKSSFGVSHKNLYWKRFKDFHW